MWRLNLAVVSIHEALRTVKALRNGTETRPAMITSAGAYAGAALTGQFFSLPMYGSPRHIHGSASSPAACGPCGLLLLGLGSGQYLLSAAAIAILLIWMSELHWQVAQVAGLALTIGSTAVPSSFWRSTATAKPREGSGAGLGQSAVRNFGLTLFLAQVGMSRAAHPP